MTTFFRCRDQLYPVGGIVRVDLAQVETLIARIHYASETVVLEGMDTIDFLMLTKPSAMEGRRLRWAKKAWRFHSYIGHPLMQLLSEFKLYALAMKVHDMTVPIPNLKRVP